MRHAQSLDLSNHFNYLRVMSSARINGSFGPLLAEVRHRRGWSQHELGIAADVSQRHISFLESGRAKPGMAALTKLMAALDLHYADINRLMLSAGFPAPRPQLGWSDAGFVEARGVIELLLQRHEPFPGVVTTRAGDILHTTAGFVSALRRVGLGQRWTSQPSVRVNNLYDLTLHEHGIGQFLVNPEQVVPHTIRRLRAASASHASAAQTLRRVAKYSLPKRWPALGSGLADSGVVVEEYRLDRDVLRLIGMTATFGTPEDVTAQELQMELFFPADSHSASLLTEPL
jgi:transcriptional regulator with XRE-family HTH domain